MVARSTIGALLLAVPVLAAAAIGFSAGPGGLPFGISSLGRCGPAGFSGTSADAAATRDNPISPLLGNASGLSLAGPPHRRRHRCGGSSAPGGRLRRRPRTRRRRTGLRRLAAVARPAAARRRRRLARPAAAPAAAARLPVDGTIDTVTGGGGSGGGSSADGRRRDRPASPSSAAARAAEAAASASGCPAPAAARRRRPVARSAARSPDQTSGLVRAIAAGAGGSFTPSSSLELGDRLLDVAVQHRGHPDRLGAVAVLAQVVDEDAVLRSSARAARRPAGRSPAAACACRTSAEITTASKSSRDPVGVVVHHPGVRDQRRSGCPPARAERTASSHRLHRLQAREQALDQPVGLDARASSRSGARTPPRPTAPVSSPRSVGERLGVLAKQPLDGLRVEAPLHAEGGEARPDVGRQDAAEVDQQGSFGVVCQPYASRRWATRLPGAEAPDGIDRAGVEGWFAANVAGAEPPLAFERDLRRALQPHLRGRPTRRAAAGRCAGRRSASGSAPPTTWAASTG